MSLTRKLFINWHTRRRQRSVTDGGLDVVNRLTFAKYETAPFEIVILEPQTEFTGQNQFRRVDITDVSLRMMINDSLDDATPLVEQSTWTKNTSNQTFSGNLPLNTAGMNLYMGSADKTPYFEIEITDTNGARVKVLTEICNVIVGIGQVASTSPDPLKEYYTKDEVLGLFMPRRGGAGETITLISPDGTHERVLGMRDDGTPQDDYA